MNILEKTYVLLLGTTMIIIALIVYIIIKIGKKLGFNDE